MRKPMELQRKTEYLLNQVVYPMLKNFPKAEKFALCQEIKQSLYRALRNILTAANVRSNKVGYLRKTDVELKLLLVLFNTAEEQRYITEKKLEQLQTLTCELGRMTGALIKKYE